MIKINISEDEIKNSLIMKELFSYLKIKNNEIKLHTEYIKGAKADLVTWITLGVTTIAAIYPIVQDIQKWVRPKRYTITITDGNITATANDLKKEEFLQLSEKLNKDKTKIEISE